MALLRRKGFPMKPTYRFQKYPSTRQVVYSNKGIVCTSCHLAAQIGADIMRRGGNAIDAAIATAAALTVIEPGANGIGSDAFALVWAKDKLHGLNASGPAPMAISAEELRAKGLTKMPEDGWTPVTVPGAPASWVSLSEKFGRLPFEQLIQPAIDAARDGYVVHETLSNIWGRGYNRFKKYEGTDPCFDEWFRIFAPEGRPPRAGEVWSSPDHAATLEKIAATKGEAFYRGELAEEIDKASRAQGGYLRKEDLAAFYPEWVEPISTNYKGYDVCEIPPNGHGITALMALNIFENFEAKSRDDVDTMHHMIEAMKLAFEDAKEYVTDPRFMKVTSSQMLNKEYAKERAALIGHEAIYPKPGQPDKGGTVYLCAADNEGNMISYIQSNYNGFGSGIVVPGTGISLQNRGSNFYLDPAHPNCVEGGKKSYHTIIPGFLMKDGQPVGPFGVMGGFMQPQGHFQVITNTIDFGLNPQDALDAPRWQWVGGKDIEVEMTFPPEMARELKFRGHNIIVSAESVLFGRGQIIWRLDNGVLAAGTEHRCDGSAAVV